MSKQYTVAEAAEILGLSKIRVNKLVASQQIAATKIGNQYVLEAHAIASYAVNRRPVGRPRKTTFDALI